MNAPCDKAPARRWIRVAQCGCLLAGALALMLVLSACAVQPVTAPADLPAAFVAHRSQVEALDPWALTGRIALDAQDEQWHTNLRWRQTGDAYDIHLFGPFGRDAGRVTGDADGAQLRASDGERYQAADVDQLVADILGWRLPVSGMRYWVMGLPAPGTGYTPRLDEAGRLAELQQSGWTVRFQRYRNTLEPALPDRLELTYEDIRVRLLVDQWNVSP